MVVQIKSSLLGQLDPAAIDRHYNRPTSADIVKATTQRNVWACQRKGTHKPKSKISISEVGKCQREIAYGFYPNFEPEDVATPEQRLLWDEAAIRGEWVHRAWQGALVDSGLVGVSPKTLNPAIELWVNELADYKNGRDLWERKLTGRMDVFLVDGTYCEIKSVANKDFNPALPWFNEKLKYEQSQLYMHYTGTKLTRFIVVNRDGDWFRDVIEIEYRLDPDFVATILSKVDRINQSVANGELPEPDPGPKKKNCMFCGFRKYCPATY